jgi:hypothetical protein
MKQKVSRGEEGKGQRVGQNNTAKANAKASTCRGKKQRREPKQRRSIRQYSEMVCGQSEGFVSNR